MDKEKTLSGYLKHRYTEHVMRTGNIITEKEYVRSVLNPLLRKESPGDRLPPGSWYQWANEGRTPDSNNIRRLIIIFGMEVLPYLGIPLPTDLQQVIENWDKASPTARRNAMLALQDSDSHANGEQATEPA